ncbi:phosphatase PAP2 family protein [Aeromicrobium chenweiae]|uniref:Inositol phosphorylceramide synthase n=1 Tax=Aeromicrobium chenweiae TaxID=2079793 RepID=A0A2S0WS57_9ACTN|nr:phosphatase PAP2 family protein [Aeromicrobium chenweiae]AWB94074.1 inositol phosphorylceramide synthase [Aeromicrobium chenweiae]TGN32701.1 inositol phosphorylceramide synthase [Aeromicrobium chenweiae]
MLRWPAAFLRWPYAFAFCLSLVVGLVTIYYSQHLDVGLKDPEGFLGPAYIRLPMIGLLIFAVAILPQSIYRYGFRNAFSGVKTIVRDEWSLHRVLHVATGMISFYICYVSYRNLKSYLPLLTGNSLHDRQLLELDHWMFFGNNPATVLHDLLGTTIAAQVLAVLYVLYLPVVPITVGAVLVLHRDFTVGAWYATAVSLNWVLGVVSYYSLPTLGPAFYEPQRFADLPDNGATQLQMSLLRGAFGFKEDPQGDKIYGIAGFASLHVSVVFTLALFLHFAGIARAVRYTAWIYLGFTVLATLYLGWHYIADDIGGLVIGGVAVWIGALVTGNTRRQRRKRSATAHEDGDPAPTTVAPDDAPAAVTTKP